MSWQTWLPGTTNIAHNTNDGIYVGAAAFSGSDAEQNVFVYDVNASNNHNSGIDLDSGGNVVNEADELIKGGVLGGTAEIIWLPLIEPVRNGTSFGDPVPGGTV